MAPYSDLVQESKLETPQITTKYTKHYFYERGTSGLDRRVRREERWRRQERLGHGSFGTVWLETCSRPARENGPRIRAVKEIPLDRTKAEGINYQHELEAMMKFSQRNYVPSFVRSFGWFESPQAISLTMEYVENGDLQKYLAQPISEDETKVIAYQLAVGLNYMHCNGFTHRDLKPGNILVVYKGPRWLVQISDFGISRRLKPDIDHATLGTLFRGTMGFVAPEMLRITPTADNCPHAVDIWSLGAVIFRMLTRELFQKDMVSLHKYAVGEAAFPEERLESVNASFPLKDLLIRLLAPCATERPLASEVLAHVWLQDIANNENSANHAQKTDSSVCSESDVESCSTQHEDDNRDAPSLAWSTGTFPVDTDHGKIPSVQLKQPAKQHGPLEGAGKAGMKMPTGDTVPESTHEKAQLSPKEDHSADEDSVPLTARFVIDEQGTAYPTDTFDTDQLDYIAFRKSNHFFYVQSTESSCSDPESEAGNPTRNVESATTARNRPPAVPQHDFQGASILNFKVPYIMAWQNSVEKREDTEFLQYLHRYGWADHLDDQQRESVIARRDGDLGGPDTGCKIPMMLLPLLTSSGTTTNLRVQFLGMFVDLPTLAGWVLDSIHHAHQQGHPVGDHEISVKELVYFLECLHFGTLRLQACYYAPMDDITWAACAKLQSTARLLYSDLSQLLKQCKQTPGVEGIRKKSGFTPERARVLLIFETLFADSELLAQTTVFVKRARAFSSIFEAAARHNHEERFHNVARPTAFTIKRVQFNLGDSESEDDDHRPNQGGKSNDETDARFFHPRPLPGRAYIFDYGVEADSTSQNRPCLQPQANREPEPGNGHQLHGTNRLYGPTHRNNVHDTEAEPGLYGNSREEPMTFRFPRPQGMTVIPGVSEGKRRESKPPRRNRPQYTIPVDHGRSTRYTVSGTRAVPAMNSYSGDESPNHSYYAARPPGVRVSSPYSSAFPKTSTNSCYTVEDVSGSINPHSYNRFYA